jgi:ATP-dependent Lon protease
MQGLPLQAVRGAREPNLVPALGQGVVDQKVLAAYRHGLKTVFLPEDNRRNLEEIPEEVLGDVKFLFAATVEEALPQMFTTLS